MSGRIKRGRAALPPDAGTFRISAGRGRERGNIHDVVFDGRGHKHTLGQALQTAAVAWKPRVRDIAIPRGGDFERRTPAADL